MRLLKVLVATLLMSPLGASIVSADEDSIAIGALSPGERVRWHFAAGGKKAQGTVDIAGPDEITVRSQDSKGPLLQLSPQQLDQLEVARGRRSHWGRGAIIGFVPGAIFFGVAAVSLDECTHECDHAGEALAYGLVGGAITGTVGALIGLAAKTDKWVPVKTGRPRMSLDLAPMRRGFRANIALAF